MIIIVFHKTYPFPAGSALDASDTDRFGDNGSIITMADDDVPIPPEIAELVHREELLRRAGEELLAEAQMLRVKCESMIGQLRSQKKQSEARSRPPVEPQGK